MRYSRFYFILFIFGYFSTINLYAQSVEPIFDIGTKWTYELSNILQNKTEYITYEVVDTVLFRGEKAWKLITPEGETYMKQKESKVYVYQEEMDDYQLTYDFDLRDSTTFYWGTFCPDSIDGDKTHESIMKIDSIVDYKLPDDKITKSQYINYKESTPIEDYGSFNRESIKYIGFKNRGLELNTGYINCDNVHYAITKLRCFENDSISYNFVGYSCDSTWIGVGTNDEIISNSIKIYSNPVSGTLKIGFQNSFTGKVEIIDELGRILITRKIDNMPNLSLNVSALRSGIYFLRVKDLKNNIKYKTERIIKIGE